MRDVKTVDISYSTAGVDDFLIKIPSSNGFKYICIGDEIEDDVSDVEFNLTTIGHQLIIDENEITVLFIPNLEKGTITWIGLFDSYCTGSSKGLDAIKIYDLCLSCKAKNKIHGMDEFIIRTFIYYVIGSYTTEVMRITSGKVLVDDAHSANEFMVISLDSASNVAILKTMDDTQEGNKPQSIFSFSTEGVHYNFLDVGKNRGCKSELERYLTMGASPNIYYTFID